MRYCASVWILAVLRDIIRDSENFQGSSGFNVGHRNISGVKRGQAGIKPTR